MKRIHVHVSVAEPTVRKDDYAKWMLDDPRVNFAVSKRGGANGLRHLGIQAEDAAELEDVYARLKRADALIPEEGATACCYAMSQKSWIDPAPVSSCCDPRAA